MQMKLILKMPMISEMINEVSLHYNYNASPTKLRSHEHARANLNPVNLGKWILRFLFDRLIQEEAKRDATFREKLLANSSRPGSIRRKNAPSSIQFPMSQSHDPQEISNEDDSVITPRPITNGLARAASTTGLTIGTATPRLNGNISVAQNDQPSILEEGTSLEKRASQHSQPRSSTERKNDYFPPSAQAKSPVDGQSKGPVTPGDTSLEGSALAPTLSPVDGDKDEKAKEGGIFGKSFRMKFPKKLGRPSTDVKPAVVDEKSEESDKSEDKEDRAIQDNFFGTIQKIRYDYEEHLQTDPFSHMSSGITPSLLSETPKLYLPPYTTVIIQDEQPDSGGVADLYRGTISSVGYDAEAIEKVAPTWLGDLLLKVKNAFFRKSNNFADDARTNCR